MKILNKILKICYLPLVIFLLLLLVKGPDSTTGLGSPLESSGSISRYMLTRAIVDDHTVYLDKQKARRASPDVAAKDGKYFSLFQPGVSFLGVPFYWLGRILALPQITTYFSTLCFAIVNTMLIITIARKLGAGDASTLISGLLFLFATSALSYALTFTQHHLSTTLVLLSILSVLGKTSLLNNLWLGVLYGAGLMVDLPNIIMMAPVMVYAFSKDFKINKKNQKIKLNVNLGVIGLLIGFLPLFGAVLWYNSHLSGSYLSLPQFVGQSYDFTGIQPTYELDTVDNPKQQPNLSEAQPFRIPLKIRHQINGLYTFLISDERGLPFYSPVIFLGILGLALALKGSETKSVVTIIMSVLLANFIVYSLFIDPTGSWSFGPRYLIPGLALAAIFISQAIDRWNHRPYFTLLFSILTLFSISVNVLGAMTTTQVPPKIEADSFPDPIHYNYKYNWKLMTDMNLNSSLIYKIWLNRAFTSIEYAGLYTAVVFTFIMGLYAVSLKPNPKH